VDSSAVHSLLCLPVLPPVDFGCCCWLCSFPSEGFFRIIIMPEPCRWQLQLEWRLRARRLLVERFGSVESGCDSLVAPLRLLELCFGEFVRQVNTECSLPCPHPYSLMEYVDTVADALDEYLLGDEDLVSLEMGFLDDSGFLRSFLLLQRKSSVLALDYCDDCSGWGQLRMSLHRLFLRIGPLVSDFVRDVSVDMLDLGDLWLRWERDELYIADARGVISPRGSGSDRSYLGLAQGSVGSVLQMAGHRLLDSQEYVLFCEWLRLRGERAG
jgi:hypothetical protein